MTTGTKSTEHEGAVAAATVATPAAQAAQAPALDALVPAPARRELHVYEPHKVGLPPLGPYARQVWQRREFAFELARNRLRSQHIDTAFGVAWLILNPILLALVYFVLIDIIRRGHQPPHFLAHLMAGIFAYYYVADAVRQGAKVVVSSGKLILNTAFPRTLLPLSTVMTAFVRFLPTLVIYAVIHVASGLPIGPTLLWIVPIIALLTVVAAGFAMVVSAAQVYFRDLNNLLPYLLRIWLYASPVLYLASAVPERYRILIDINPIGALLTCWSQVLYGGQAPDLAHMAIGCAWALVLFVGGALFFMSREREFAVRV